jgi:DNA-binding protein YbaB
MRSAAILAALCALLLNVGLAQVKPTPSLQTTRLEAFAGQPTAQVTWSKEVGQIDSNEARVVVTALIVEAAAQPRQRMRGIRIDLAKKNATDQVYLEEAVLEAVSKALEEIESEIESFRKEPASSPYRYHGAAEFWHPHLKVHTLNAAYYIAPDSSGLSLSAYREQEFRFPDHRPSELAKVIGKAMDELKQH